MIVVIFMFFLLIWGVGRPFGSHLGIWPSTNLEQADSLTPCLGFVFVKFRAKIILWDMFVASIFEHMFGIAFRRHVASVCFHVGVVFACVFGLCWILLCRCCKSVKLQPLSSETPVFKGARPPLLHTFHHFFACVFRQGARTAFFVDFFRF